MVKVKILLDCTRSLLLWYTQTNVFNGATTLVTTTFSITALRIRGLFVTLSKNDTHCIKNHDIMLSLLISKSICERYFFEIHSFCIELLIPRSRIASYHFLVSVQPSRPCLLQTDILLSRQIEQGIQKGEISLYGWPPVWLVWNQLFDWFGISCLTGLESAVWLLWIFVFICKQTNPSQSNRRSTTQWYFPL